MPLHSKTRNWTKEQDTTLTLVNGGNCGGNVVILQTNVTFNTIVLFCYLPNISAQFVRYATNILS